VDKVVGRMTRDMENAALDKNQVGGVLANLYGGRVSQACKAVDHRPALLEASLGQVSRMVQHQLDRHNSRLTTTSTRIGSSYSASSW
jgi:hypothetical protein